MFTEERYKCMLGHMLIIETEFFHGTDSTVGAYDSILGAGIITNMRYDDDGVEVCVSPYAINAEFNPFSGWTRHFSLDELECIMTNGYIDISGEEDGDMYCHHLHSIQLHHITHQHFLNVINKKC